MTKTELIRLVAAKNTNLTQGQVGTVLESLFETILEQAKTGAKVGWGGFGHFTVQKREARDGRNPKTGATVRIAASEVLKFRAAAATKVVTPEPVPTKVVPAKKK